MDFADDLHRDRILVHCIDIYTDYLSWRIEQVN